MNDESTEAIVEEPAEQQVAASSISRWLSLVAVALFILFVLSRQLDWATFHIVVPGGKSVVSNDTAISGTSAWHALSTPLILCAIALIPINLFFLFSENVLDPLAPAIANCAVGIALVGASIYFIAKVNDILGGAAGRSVQLTYQVETGAYVATAIAVLLLATGLWQLRMRLND